MLMSRIEGSPGVSACRNCFPVVTSVFLYMLISYNVKIRVSCTFVLTGKLTNVMSKYYILPKLQCNSTTSSELYTTTTLPWRVNQAPVMLSCN